MQRDAWHATGLQWMKRHRRSAIAGAVSAAVLIAVIVTVGGCVTRSAPPPTRPAPQPAPPPPPPRPAPPEAPAPGEVAPAASNPMLTIQLVAGPRSVTVQAAVPMTVETDQGAQTLAPGRWELRAGNATPARYRYAAFIKSFKPHDRASAEALMQAWRAQGFQTDIVTLGQVHTTADRHVLEGRTLWVTLGHFASEQEANAVKKLVEGQGQSVWIRPERVEAGHGPVTIAGSSGSGYQASAPLTLKASGPITIVNHPGGDARSYSGELDFAIENDGTLGVYEQIDMETYLAGVLPSEMPALWPEEALKAQAVAARSDVLKHMNEKRILEGYHFVATVSDRMYKGAGGRHPRTDAAVAATRGMVATDGVRILPGVFSSNCGGWTDANETAWIGPPDPALRPVHDAPGSTGPAPFTGNMANWLAQSGGAYCSGDPAGYRWSKRLSQAEVTRLVNQHYNVGTVQRVQLGDRGPGGRLMAVTVQGTRGSATIQRELPIRRAFGSLPSAMFIINGGEAASGSVYTFQGGGRGHGVGLCQHGARGMAGSGADFRSIIRHYYAGARVVQLQ